MTGKAAPGSAATAPPKTLADKVNWVLDTAHTAGRGRLSDAQVVFKIHEVTGEKISTTTIWKLRNGQQANPQIRVIQALARTFSVPAFSLRTTTRASSGYGGSRWNCWPSSGIRGSPPPRSGPSSGWTTRAAR